MTGEKKIRCAFTPAEVQWVRVLDVLVNRFRVPFLTADEQVRQFLKRLHRPFSLEFFRGRALSESDRQLMAAVCEAHGIDLPTFRIEKKLRVAGVGIEYRKILDVEPCLSRATGGAAEVRARIDVEVCGVSLVLTRLWQVVALNGVLTLLAILSYVLLVGAFLYGSAVLVVLILEPVGTAITATRHGGIGLALLCILVGAAGVFGRALANVSRLGLTRLGLRRPAVD